MNAFQLSSHPSASRTFPLLISVTVWAGVALGGKDATSDEAAPVLLVNPHSAPAANTPASSPTNRRLPNSTLLALGAAVKVQRIDQAFPATNDRQRFQAGRRDKTAAAYVQQQTDMSKPQAAAYESPGGTQTGGRAIVDAHVRRAAWITDLAETKKPMPKITDGNPLRGNSSQQPLSSAGLNTRGANPLR